MSTIRALRTVALAGLALAFAPGAGNGGVSTTPLLPMSTILSFPVVACTPDRVPHILYPSPDEYLHHSWFEGGAWKDELVDTRNGANADCVVDLAGRLHVVYLAWTGWTLEESVLVHGVRDASGWKHTDLAPNSRLHLIAIGPDDRPRVLLTSPEGALRVLRFDGAAWVIEETGLPGTSSGFTAHWIVDADGDGHAVFERWGNLYYASNSTGTWEEVILSRWPFVFGTLALDSLGRPHVVAGNASFHSEHRLFHFWRDESGWREEEVLARDASLEFRTVGDLICDDSGHIFAQVTGGYFRHSFAISVSRLVYFDGVEWRDANAGGTRAAIIGSLVLGADGAFHGASDYRSRVQYVRIAFPDLAAEWASFDRRDRQSGESVRGEIRIRNEGPGRSRATRVALYLSDDDRFDEADTRVGGQWRLGGIRPGGERTLRVSARLPEGAAGRRLLAVVDPDARREDIDRPNNTAAEPAGLPGE
jgi:hypothetical protein